MKKFCLFFLIIINYYNTLAKPHSALPPTATIVGTQTVCQNTTGVVITFTGSGGTAPYTFTYTINGGTPQTITSTGNSVNVNVNTSIATTLNYSLLSFHDATTPVTEIVKNDSQIVTINPQPDATINGTGSGTIFNGIPVFRVCNNTTQTFTFTNGSNTSTSNTHYKIVWGDGTPDFDNANWNTPLTHQYSVGLWNLEYTIENIIGCPVTKKYIVFVGSNPAVSLGNPGNTDICISSDLTFPITGTTNNPPGTTYTVTFNDGSTPAVFNHPPPASITHIFKSTSCGITSSNGTTSFQNSFSANIVAQNPCGTSAVGVVPIYVSTPPVADFTLPTKECTNVPICITNTSTGAFENNGSSSNCSTSPKFIWSISPSTGFIISSGSLGNDSGLTDSNLWTSGSTPLCIKFTQAGTYTITIKTGNRCGFDTKTKTICIEPPLTPSFTLNTNSFCTANPTLITATNTTDLTNQCSAATYNWHVTYTATNCGSSITTISDQTTRDANFNFTEPGKYDIKLTTTNSCGSSTTTQSINVKKPPTITSINGLAANYCGTATISPTALVNSCAPASSNLTYNWSFPGGNPTSSTDQNPLNIVYSNTGTHEITLIVSNECGSTTLKKSFTINEIPVLTTTPLAQTICSGTRTTAINLTSNVSGSTFTWIASATTGISGYTASGTTNTIPDQNITTTNTSAGTITYTITPKTASCTGTSVDYKITVNPAPTITSQPTSSIVCKDNTPTLLSVVLNSTSVTPTYQWYVNTVNSSTGGTLIPAQTTSTYNPPTITAGTSYYYCVITLSSAGCSSLISNIASVTVNPLPTIVTQPLQSQNICVGGTISNPLSVTYKDGVGTPSYQWYSNTTNSPLGGTAISGANSSTYTPPTFTTTGNFYYYVVMNFSGNGCGSLTSDISEIIVVNDPTITYQPLATQTLCQNAIPTNLTVTATGGSGTYLYQWYRTTTSTTTGGTAIGTNSATFTPPTNSVGTFYYYCLITQTGTNCDVKSNSSTVIINTSPTIVNQPVSSTVCLNGTPTTLSFTFANGIGTPTYQWFSNPTNSNSGGNLLANETNPTYTPPGTSIGTLYYYCVITFPSLVGNCSSIATNATSVTVNPLATIDTQPLPTQNICVGGTISNSLSVTSKDGAGTPSYQWYSNTSNSSSGGTAISSANSSTYTPSAFTATGNFYYYVVINFSGNGCGSLTSDISEIIVVNDPTITSQPLATQTLCQNTIPTNLTVAATGGIGTYLYQWYSNTSNNTSGGTLIGGATNDTYTPLTTNAGTLYYYCLITQTGLNCNVKSQISQVNVNIPPTIANQPISNTICIGSTPTPLNVTYINGVGTPSYQWYSNSTNTTIGGSIIVTATSSSYSPPSNLAGTVYYYCTITFPSLIGGCNLITSTTAQVTINLNPIISPQTATICSATSFLITPSNSSSDIVPTGTTYTWSTPVINPSGSITGATSQTTPQTSISQILTNTTLGIGTATYTVTPKSGSCVGVTFTITITVNPATNPNAVKTDSTCFGINNGNITTNSTGGIPFTTGLPYIISWTGPNSFTSSFPNITNLVPGTYNLTINDAGGCPISTSYTINEPTEIALTTTINNNITCFGSNNGAIAISVIGGTGAYTYSWTKNGSPYATTANISNLGPATYVVSVSDANHCGPKTRSFTITEPPLLSVNLVNQINVECYGFATGAITINTTGGTPIQTAPGVFDYIYSWTGPNGFTSTNQNISNLIAGTYRLTVTDNLGCSKNLTVIITQSTEIIINATTTPIVCYGNNDATMTISISGGNAPYQVQWSNLAIGLYQDNLAPGNYTITVTDSKNCQKTAVINIPSPPIFTVNPIVTNISCFGAHDGSIVLNFVGGVAPVKLVWSDGSTAGVSRNNLGAGTYTVVITDSKPCTITKTFTIIEPQPLVLSANTADALDCNNANSGTINLLVSGGTPPFNYTWNNGATSEDLNNIPAGNYAVTVTDSRGCTKTAQYTINRPNPLALSVNTTTTANCATHTVSQIFTAQPSGGVPPYQLNWSNGTVSGTNNELMTTTQNGLVSLTATDAIGCKKIYSLNVAIPVLGNPSFTQNSIGYTSYGLYAVLDPIQFNSTITGNYTSVLWDFGDGTFSNELNPTHTYLKTNDSYLVTQTVTYPFGCVYVMTQTLKVEKGYVLVVPVAFTPNNKDGVNDTFRPVTKGLKNIQLDIYDTWGSLIYSEVGNVIVGWNGKIKGINSENGNYYAKVSAETFYGTIVSENHPLLLFK
jgi:gliding motility-associated-like protein